MDICYRRPEKGNKMCSEECVDKDQWHDGRKTVQGFTEVGVECVNCGFCCLVPAIQITEEDEKRLPEKYRKMVVKSKDKMGGSYIFGVLKRIGKKLVFSCPFLKGTIGKKVRCSIYKHRPQVCMEFDRGSPFCSKLVSLMRANNYTDLEIGI